MRYDIGYITELMLEYNPGIPQSAIVGTAIALCGVAVVLSLLQEDLPTLVRNVTSTCFCLYVILVLFITLILRDSSVKTGWVLRPFWLETEFYTRMIAEILLNILLFLPVGFLAGAIPIKSGFLKVCGGGCVLSLTIELLQLLTRRGVFNINDVMHNTIGCAIGYCLFILCRYILVIFTKDA